MNFVHPAEKRGPIEMTTAIAHTFKPTRSRVLTVVTVLAILFGCYGLLSAQQARSATTLPKHVWGGIRQDGTIAHQKHITAASRATTGAYFVTFDRHVDNCAIEVTARYEGGFVSSTQFNVSTGNSTSQVQVFELNANGVGLADGDFDIFGMCPSS